MYHPAPSPPASGGKSVTTSPAARRSIVGGVSAVHEHGTGQVGGDTERAHHLGDGTAFGNVEERRACVMVVRQITSDGSEEPDFDPHFAVGSP